MIVMKNFFLKLQPALAAFLLMSCQGEELNAKTLSDLTTSNGGKTLIVYYSYTGNTEQIASDLKTIISADIIEIEPVEKNLDYAANNYAIGTEQLNKIKANPSEESSYPAIEPVNVDLSGYETVIIATPLWWSQMASNMQTFLFKFGKKMAGKNIGLIVSSVSSGISIVENDAKRLVPNGNFTKSLWINASKHSQRKALLEEWLNEIGFKQSQNQSSMFLKVNNSILTVQLADNEATKALLGRLQNGDISFKANDYGGFEKVGALGFSLPSNDVSLSTEAGDVMLYSSNQLCIFFDKHSWSYTPIGKIEGKTAEELKNVFGAGEVSITLSIDNTTGISSVFENKHKSQTKLKGIYSLSGQKLSKVPEHGVYIEDGVKKVK